MTIKRQQEIKEEAERRLKLLLENLTLEEISSGGSRLRFSMSLGMFGYPFEKPKWMKGEGFNKFVTEKEFDSKEYDDIVEELFNKTK